MAEGAFLIPEEAKESHVKPESWQRLKELFASAEPLKGAEREAFVAAHCSEDPELYAALKRLLLRNDGIGEFMADPIVRIPSPPVHRRLTSGDIVNGRLHIEVLLGAGGMGEVYRAHDARLNRSVAVKVLPRVLNDPEHRSRLHREARAVAALSHPNICSLFDVDTDQGCDYLVFEYLEGETLATRLRGGALCFADCRQIGWEVAGALAYAHQRGVIHRDIKPANVMLTPFGTKVLDFGIAKWQTPSASEGEQFDSVTAIGQVVGSVPYMSPEQAEGKSIDHRSDVFSFGCVLYEMMTGSRAFPGHTAGATLGSILYSEPKPLAEVMVAAPPPTLVRILDKCLKKRPCDRFQSMSEVVQALRVAPPDEFTGHTSQVNSPRSHDRLRSLRWYITVAAAILVLVLTATSFWKLRTAAALPAGSAAIVLPFANVGDDKDLEYLADGLSESLTNTLSRIPAIRVLARTTAFRYKGQEIDVVKIGRELNVAVVVTGKLSRSADKVLIQADLINAHDGVQLWGDRYETQIGSTLAVQKDIVRSLSAQLAGTLTEEERQRLTSHSTTRSDAYDSYLKGRYAMFRFTVPDIHKGIAFFQKALESDPKYALAYTGLADSYGLLSSMYLKPAEAMTKAKAAADKALAVDSTLAEAHLSSGLVSGWYEFNWAKSEASLRRAVELSPNDANARLWLGLNLTMTGRAKEGVAHGRAAHKLDPLSAYVETGLGQMLAFAGEREAAIRQLESVTAADPNFFGGHHFLGTIYVAAKRNETAVASFQRARQLDPEQPQPIAYLAYARAMSGDQASARKLIAELTELRKQRYVSGFLFAIASLALGAHDDALSWLEKAYEERDDMLCVLAIDELLDPLRSNPRFQSLMRKVGFTDHRTNLQ